MTAAELEQLESDRQAAKRLKHRFYFPATACISGHIAKRYTRNGECIVCSADRGARIYRDDPDRIKRYAARRDPVLEAAKRARQARGRYRRDPSGAKLVSKRYRQHNRDKVLARTKAWKAKNREHVTAYDNKHKTAWRAANPEAAKLKGRLAAQRRRAAARKAPGHFTAADIDRLFKKQHGRCAGPHCRVDISARYEIDHKRPLVRGGSHWPRNLQLLCRSCNARKHDRTMAEWLASLGNAIGSGLVYCRRPCYNRLANRQENPNG